MRFCCAKMVYFLAFFPEFLPVAKGGQLLLATALKFVKEWLDFRPEYLVFLHALHKVVSASHWTRLERCKKS